MWDSRDTFINPQGGWLAKASYRTLFEGFLGGDSISFATGGGAGLHVLINKCSTTNLCFDVGFGKQGSTGVYLAIQEAF